MRSYLERAISIARAQEDLDSVARRSPSARKPPACGLHSLRVHAAESGDYKPLDEAMTACESPPLMFQASPASELLEAQAFRTADLECAMLAPAAFAAPPSGLRGRDMPACSTSPAAASSSTSTVLKAKAEPSEARPGQSLMRLPSACSANQAASLEHGNMHCKFCVQVITAGLRTSCSISMENPDGSWLWRQPSVVQLLKKHELGF